jgi:hypothetical protein
VKQIQDLTLFPNPAMENLNLKFKSDYELNMEVIIYDVSGNNLASFNMDPRKGWNDYSIDLSSFKEGMYILSLTNDHQRVIKKFFISK